ncbi:hypothetical protein [Thiomicrorhabdus xiamenensis]|uniref:Uncharacterized protein n=1 Tax=Thiomicrorhabdus xiamenensis TaxID=2739063 RepID=A0A7D4T1P1_9GAMM|nr:hypothetical protein [Thiomicrorhabdus xiamenensis]QKI89745.1 hypothetical protein HQN79_09265 [Thiomicrorhabdus xiamenensis]
MENLRLDNLEVTTLGWQYSQWQDTFYPDDLPEEWRLDFYLNHFRLAAIPQHIWLPWLLDEGLDEEPFDDFVDCLNENTLLLLIVAEEQLAQLERLLELTQGSDFAERLIGCAVLAEMQLPPSEIQGLPVTLVSSRLTFPGWSWRNDGVVVSGQPMAWINDLPQDGKQQADLLKDLVASIPQQKSAVPVCVANPEMSISSVQNLKTVAELLGY